MRSYEGWKFKGKKRIWGHKRVLLMESREQLLYAEAIMFRALEFMIKVYLILSKVKINGIF